MSEVVFEFITSPPGRSQLKYCNEYVSLFVCLSVCVRNSKTTRPNFINFLRSGILPVAMARSSSDGVAIC